MSRVGAARVMVGPRPQGLVAASLVLLALAAAFGAGAAMAPGLLRLLFALGITLALVTLCLTEPRAGVLATLVFLVVLALVRRLLIADAGWAPFDPLLLVGPLVLAVLCVQLFLLEGRPLAPDPISKLVVAVLILTVLQIANPAGGGPLAGMGGFLFVGIPLVWFLVGRELTDAVLAQRLVLLALVVAVAVGAYGLYQTQIAFPSWDAAWVRINGYGALHVGSQIRAFGTFSSSAEYSLFLSTGLAISVAFVLQRRPEPVLAVPLIAVALFFSSSRSPLVTAFVAVVVLAAIRPRRPLLAVVITLVAVGGAVVALSAFGGALSSSADSSGNSLIAHQVGGITDPLNSRDSTLLTHVGMVAWGFRSGVVDPLGKGTGSTNDAGAKLGGVGGGATEIDISNAFVGLGAAGGLLYLALVVLVLVRGLRGYFAGNDRLLPVLGLLICTLGQWLMGAHYALSPLTWILIGYLARSTAALPWAGAAAPRGRA